MSASLRDKAASAANLLKMKHGTMCADERGEAMNRKYELTGEKKEYHNHTLHRIRAIRDFGDVKAGDLGGWVEREQNLSHDGNAWVGGDAKVYGMAKVFQNALVFDNAKVRGLALVYGNAKVYGQAKIRDCADVRGMAKIFDDAEVCDNAVVSGRASICGDARVRGNNEVA